ncbi:hypothetical protein [Paracoccus sp. (in: a-proteobacteria)]|uniref:hypothetical protein n=1 Tax=Paracoccus sp. TaxID=267 RepID=UPI003A8C2D8F
MRMIKTGTAAILALLALPACNPSAMTGGTARPTATATPEVTEQIDTNLSQEQVAEARAITTAPPPRAATRASAAQLDTTTTEQKAAAARAPAASEQRLGTTIASLGDPTEGGFWIKTPLVSQRGIGRIVNPATGKSAKVDLIPLDGPASSGSQVSLPALQLIGVSLTDLPEIEVFKS